MQERGASQIQVSPYPAHGGWRGWAGGFLRNQRVPGNEAVWGNVAQARPPRSNLDRRARRALNPYRRAGLVNYAQAEGACRKSPEIRSLLLEDSLP
jgi:hypothetical protein